MFFKYDKLPYYFMGNLVFRREGKGSAKKDGCRVFSSCGNERRAKSKFCKLVIYTVQLPLKEIKGHTRGSGDAETPTNAAQLHQAGEHAHAAPQAGTVPSSFLQQSGGRGKSSAPAPSTHPPEPRPRAPAAS